MVDELQIRFGAECVVNGRLDVVFENGGDRESIFFSSSDAELVPRADALAACALLPAMRLDQELRIEWALSPRLMGNLSTIQDLYRSWDEGLQKVPVSFKGSALEVKESGSRVGLFFTGGADSFYSLFKHFDEITDLIFVHGFDIPVDQQELGDRVAGHLRKIAAECGKRFLLIKTDLRGLLCRHGDWGKLMHGAALAAVAHLLPGSIGKLYIASSFYDEYYIPWGSHPELDPLWSSDRLELVHDGSEVRRLDKLRFIADYPLAMKSLRVCWKNTGEAYNCCRCEKCLRTMLNLQALGALARCPAFEQALELKRVRWMKEAHPGFIKLHLNYFSDSPENRGIRRALKFAAGWNQLRRWVGC